MLLRSAASLRPLLFGIGLVLTAAWLQGCSPLGVAAGAGATAGVTAMQERGFSGAISDTGIRVDINSKWLQEDEEMYRKLNLQVQEGRVLLTGLLSSEEMRGTAVRLAWQVEGVEEVINEIEIGDLSMSQLATDTWISTQLKSDLLLDSEIYSINYSIETVNGIVYLIGVARSEEELQRVLNYARNLASVQEVVSYVRVMTPEERREAPEGDSPQQAPDGETSPEAT